ncbi:MAG: hypothetical protein ACI4P6_01550 [Candidatus Spyradosoma sp.]
MAPRLTVLSAASAGASRAGATDFAFHEALDALGVFADADASVFFCAGPRAGETRENRLTAREAFRDNLFAACGRVTTGSAAVAEALGRAAAASDALLLGDVEGLSAAEWTPALPRARRVVAWVLSDWPREFPACDPVWTEARRGPLPRRLVASTCVKLAYKKNPAHRDVLSAVSAAVFADETLRERNARSFPRLKDAFVAPPPIDAEIFRFKPCAPARKNLWGCFGDADSEPEELETALKIFAFEALRNPECRFRVFADVSSPAGQKIVARVRSHPALAPRTAFAPPPGGNAELAAALRALGVLVAPRRVRKSAFPQLVALAVACGCFPICGKDAETSALLARRPTEMLFNAETPSSAFLICEKLKSLAPENLSAALEPLAREILAAAEKTRVAGVLSAALAA